MLFYRPRAFAAPAAHVVHILESTVLSLRRDIWPAILYPLESPSEIALEVQL